MVGQRHAIGCFQQFILVLADDVRTHLRVLAHYVPFVGVELAGLEEYVVRNADFRLS
jgi:hypothetical protein